jgi:hypothetical protein
VLAGMTDDQPKRGRPSDYSFQVAGSTGDRGRIMPAWDPTAWLSELLKQIVRLIQKQSRHNARLKLKVAQEYL